MSHSKTTPSLLKNIGDMLLGLLVLFVMSGAALACVVGGLIWLGILIHHHWH